MRSSTARRVSGFVALMGMALPVALTAASAGCEVNDCRAIGGATCDRACECAEGDACVIATQSGVTVSFDTEADCRGLYVDFLCGPYSEPPVLVDPDACLQAIEAASCATTADGMALDYPSEACEEA